MARIPLFGIGIAAKSPFVSAKRLQNIYVEKRPQGEKSLLVGYGTPGQTLFVDFGETPLRGGMEFPQNNVAYVVHRGTLWEVNNAGTKTSRGTLLTTTGRVSIEHNGVQVMITDGTAGYIYNTSTLAFAQISDPDFPALPITCAVLGRRFIANFVNSGRFYVSDIDNGLAWDALNFANAESNPDNIVAVWVSNGQLILLGQRTTEFWGNSGALDFPFAALQGTANEWGLGATWSLAKYDNTFACLITNRMGQVMIAKMGGYVPDKISNPDLDSIINGYSATSNATSYSYMLGGHPMYVITFPSANDGEGATWLYDGSTGIWSSLKSQGSTRHNAEFSFNLVGRTTISDYATGRLLYLDGDVLTDNGMSIEREIVGETISSNDLTWLNVNRMRVDMETGIGTTQSQGVNPQIGLSISRDNGKTWGPSMWRTAGKIGEYRTRVEWRRLGTTRSFTPKLQLTDPVKLAIVSACLNPDN